MKKLLLLIFPLLAFAHKGHHHEQMPPATPEANQKLLSINQEYLKSVKPIFVKSCFDCHSSSTHYPWYSKLPGVHWLVTSDISEAKEHIDMSPDFPFKSHATPKEDLDAIRDEIREGDMPPFRYWVLHPGTRLSKEERALVEQWAEQGLKTLE